MICADFGTGWDGERDGPVVSGDESTLRMGLKLPYPHLHSVGQQPVIRVQKHHILSPGLRQAPVAGPRQAPVLLADEAHLLVARGYLRSVIGGAVVHDDELEVRITLGQDALYGFGEEVGLVVAGDHHAYQTCTCCPWKPAMIGHFAPPVGQTGLPVGPSGPPLISSISQRLTRSDSLKQIDFTQFTIIESLTNSVLYILVAAEFLRWPGSLQLAMPFRQPESGLMVTSWYAVLPQVAGVGTNAASTWTSFHSLPYADRRPYSIYPSLQ